MLLERGFRSELTRRRFLQTLGAGFASGAIAGLRPERLLALARPLAPGEPILVSIFLGGGLDGAHLLVPTGANDYGHYVDQRGALAVELASTLPLAPDASVNAVMPRLHARALAGDIAFVRGVDLLGASGFDPLSHFDKTDYVMSGRSSPGGPSGALGGRAARESAAARDRRVRRAAHVLRRVRRRRRPACPRASTTRWAPAAAATSSCSPRRSATSPARTPRAPPRSTPGSRTPAALRSRSLAISRASTPPRSPARASSRATCA
jgi:uncharacterized protein (DUF1501 family)